MGMVETRLSATISEYSRFGPSFSTSLVRLDSAADEANARWSQFPIVGNLRYGIRKRADVAEILRCARALKGPADIMRVKDWSDFASTADGGTSLVAVTALDQDIGTGDGSKTTFQLRKAYTFGAAVHYRNITKPVSGTVLGAVNGVTKTPGVDFTVDTTTGTVTYAVAPANGLVVTAGFEFDVPMRFGIEIDRALQVSVVNFDAASVPDIPVVEALSAIAAPEEHFFGDGQSIAFAAPISISVLSGCTLTLTPAGAGLTVTLPAVASLVKGGPYFILINGSATNTFDVKDESGATVATVAVSGLTGGAGGTKQFWLAASLAGGKQWVAW